MGLLLGLATVPAGAQLSIGRSPIAASNMPRVADRALARFDQVVRDGELSDLAPLFAATGALVDLRGDSARGPSRIMAWARALTRSGTNLRFVRTLSTRETCADGPYESGVFAVVRHEGARTATELKGVYAVRWRAVTADSIAIAVMRWWPDSAHMDEGPVRRECLTPRMAVLRAHRVEVVAGVAAVGGLAADAIRLFPAGATQLTPFPAMPGTITTPSITVRIRTRTLTIETGTTGWVGSGPYSVRTTYSCCGHFYGHTDSQAAPSEREIHLLATREQAIFAYGVGVTVINTNPRYSVNVVDCITEYMGTPGGCSNKSPTVDRQVKALVAPTLGASVQIPLGAGVFLDGSVRLRFLTTERYTYLASGDMHHGMWAFNVGIGRGAF